jgi:protein-tyrosine phosphatase
LSEQFSVLVVCLGNICRSPLAERLLRLRLDGLLGDRRDAVGVSSAGVRAVVGSPMDAHAAAELRRLGGDPDGFAGRQMTADLAASADLVLTATRTLRSRVLEEAPRALKRTFTIRELAALSGSAGVRERPVKSPADLVARAASWRGSETVDDYDVPDPIGRSAEFHRTVADLLDVDCTRIARAVASAVDLSDVPRTEVS